ncbi:choice-of-anchor J domain-containing protein [Pontibacter sp. Tf4]|uniref:T9SS-dependent choice-of-anchor J family protein n=1 Tax=Pontibacter sp. Tf4 TaxID=2761620 RepID=UPI00162A494C|nr:choice-of-anchor J domain-containing protein [Pontibacter sp. Tf4]MBB6610878.1 choice-of-anchor J domain-containing protein [Pontibacter sp. Tf4]
MSKHLQKLCALVLVCCAWLGSSTAFGQVNLQQSPYTENFDALSSGYPTGWSGLRLAGSGTIGQALAPTVSDGSATSGAVYSVGLDTDRALGTLASGSTMPAFGAAFTNNTGNTLNQIKISAMMEQWKSGSRDDHHEVVKFAYSLNATSLDDANATWIEKTELDLVEILTTTKVAAAVNGNDAANRTAISLDLGGISWAEGTTLWIRWADADNVGSDGMYAVDDFKIEFESGSTTPAIFAPSSLNLGETIIEKAQTGSYTFTATNLKAPVKVTADAPFLVSKTAGGTYAAEIEFTAAELASEATVYVKVSPSTFGVVNGNITHTSTGAATVTVAATVISHSPYAQDFNTCTGNATIAGGWMQYSVTGDQTWACTTFGTPGTDGKMTNAVQMSGFASGNQENEDWLISPALDLAGFDIPVVSFNYRTKFAGDGLKVMVSTNYSGTGAPSAATWTELVSLPADEADEWKLLENLGLLDYKSANTYVAFVYTSTTESAPRWTLDNFEVKGVANYLSTSNIVMNFPETAAGSTSDAMKFTFSAVGFDENVVLSAPANFELSKDGTTYAATLTYTAAEAAANNEVFVRFAPSATAHLYTGAVTFTSGETVITRGMLSGSSLLKSNTLDVVTWNMKWFGATGQGPSNEELQFENAKKVIEHLNADIIGVQEVADDAKIAELAAATGYTYITKPVTGQQQIGFLYKADVVTVRKDKVLLSKLFNDIKAGTTNLTDYPTGDELFWASGRLPYMVEFEANIDGAKQRIHVINLHAKANGDNSDLDYQRRQYDAKVLSDSLAAQYGNVNLILLGDFNDDVDVSVVGTNQKSSFDVFVADEANYSTLTLDLSKADKVTYESGSLRSFLDHIFISNELTDEYVASSIAIEEQLLNLIPNFRSTTSDHLPVSARFTVTNTTYPVAVAFSQASVSKTEDAGTFTVSLTVAEAVATAQTVTIAPKAGATASAADYTIAGAENGTVTVTIPANATTASFDVTIVDDTETEEAELVVFEITGASNGLEIGTAKTFTLTIEANDAPTGIADGTKGQFSIYPTIVNGGNIKLQLPERVAQTAKVNMVVYSTEGRNVLSVNGTQAAAQNALNSKVATLPAGIYMVLIETGKEYFQTKMVRH